jgi:hypothetical protein
MAMTTRRRAALAFVPAALLASVLHASLLTWQYARSDVSNLNTASGNAIRFVLFVVYGVPVAAIVTVVLGLPVYQLVKRTVGISGGSALLAGGAIGLTVSLVFSTFASAAIIASPLVGFAIGAVCAAVWWVLGGR